MSFCGGSSGRDPRDNLSEKPLLPLILHPPLLHTCAMMMSGRKRDGTRSAHPNKTKPNQKALAACVWWCPPMQKFKIQISSNPVAIPVGAGKRSAPGQFAERRLAEK